MQVIPVEMYSESMAGAVGGKIFIACVIPTLGRIITDTRGLGMKIHILARLREIATIFTDNISAAILTLCSIADWW